MNKALSNQYELLNSLTFECRNFFQELLRVGMKEGLISIGKGVQCREFMLDNIAADGEIWMSKNGFDAGIGEYRQIYYKNHMYILSFYLYEKYCPAEALAYLMNEPIQRVRGEAISYFKSRINDIYKKVSSYACEIKLDSCLYKPYKDLQRTISDIYSFDSRAKQLVGDIIWEADYIWELEYVTMNYNDLDIEDIVESLMVYEKGFYIETSIVNKFADKMNHIVHGDYEEFLSNILYEYAYSLLKPEYLERREDNIRDKRKIVLQFGVDEVFQMLFSHEEIISFSDEEKEYIRMYFMK